MFVAFAVATACTVTNVDDVVVAPVQSQGVQIVSRILPFADYDVSTRAAKNSQETEAKTLDFVILGASGKCIFYKHTNGDTTISIDKEADFGGISTDEYNNCGIYVLVNYPALYNKIVEDALEDGANSTDEYVANNIIGKLDGYYFIGATPVEATSQIPSSGLPMYGSKTDVDLSNFSNGEAITVPVESLYSKIVFDISVNPTQSMPKTPVFKLNGYTIKNLATTIDILGGTESVRVEDDTKPKVTVVENIKGTSDSVDGVHDAVEGDLTGVDTKADQEVSFSFYLPERYLQIGNVDEFGYPFGSGANIRQEDAMYRQRYKPLLAKGFTSYTANQQTKVSDPKATYVTFYGVYTNHQGHSYNVSYDIYVGNDNYSNFDTVRNRQYNNTIVIRGITNSNDQSSGANAVAVDHRVDVSRTQPAIINLRRETLLDSHFEVRPLRIRQSDAEEFKNETGMYATVSVNYKNGEQTPWIGLEQNNGTGSVTATYCASGKRKYFTTDLVTNTLNAANGGQSVSVDIEENNNTVWIYVDENLSVSDNVRSADIVIRYYRSNGAKIGEPVTYTIVQRNLYPVATTRNADIDGTSDRSTTYYIEYEEEYLYDFDAEDSFGKTDQSGMAWGLDGVQLSNSIDAADVSYNMSGWGSLLASFGWDQVKLFKEVFNELNIKYDFYLWRDVKDVNALKNATDKKYSCFNGHTYNKNIVSTLKESSDSKAKVDGIQLDEQPQSAIAYCYNKNKRDSEGKVTEIKWYLPAIDEVEDIAEFAYDFKGGVFQGNLYWSCQPAYYQNDLSLDLWKRHIFKGWGDTGDDVPGFYYTDDKTHARATRALKEYNTTTEKYEFAGVLDSGSGIYGTQGGELRVSEIPGLTDVYVQYIDADHYTKNTNFSYDGHPGNLSRKDQKARVRCVRIDDKSV